MIFASGRAEAEREARRHYAAGVGHVRQEAWAEALREFGEAHRLTRRPGLLRNLSLCHEHLGDLDKALFTLEQYLAESPRAHDRAAIEARIARLRDAMARHLAPPAPDPSLAPLPPDLDSPGDERPRRVATWVVGALGLGLLGGALAANLVAGSELSALRARCGADGTCDPSVFPGAAGAIEAGRAAAIASYVLAGAGAAALATAVVLFFVEGRRRLEAQAALAPWLAPGGAGLALGGRF